MTTTDKLAEAIELAEDAMAYVPEYFANKHGMLRRMAALKEVAAHDAEQAQEAQRRERLTDPQIAEGRYRTWAAEPDDAPEAWSFLRGARWAESALAVQWGVKLGATTGEQR